MASESLTWLTWFRSSNDGLPSWGAHARTRARRRTKSLTLVSNEKRRRRRANQARYPASRGAHARAHARRTKSFTLASNEAPRRRAKQSKPTNQQTADWRTEIFFSSENKCEIQFSFVWIFFIELSIKKIISSLHLENIPFGKTFWNFSHWTFHVCVWTLKYFCLATET